MFSIMWELASIFFLFDSILLDSFFNVDVRFLSFYIVQNKKKKLYLIINNLYYKYFQFNLFSLIIEVDMLLKEVKNCSKKFFI